MIKYFTIEDLLKHYLQKKFHILQKKYADAITWHKKALEIRQEIYPDNEPIIAASLTMIGNDYTPVSYTHLTLPTILLV